MRRTSLVVIVLLALSSCSSDDGAPTSKPNVGPAISIEGFAYSPTPLTVAPGATIAVTNKDGQSHTVTSDIAGLFVADKVRQGTSVSFTAPAKAGTYTFHCGYHSRMTGTLVVKG